MDAPTSPPPLPPVSGNKRLWIILSAVAVIVAIGVVALGALGVFGFRRIQEKRAAAQQATSQLQQVATEERAKMAEMIRSGEVTDGDAALGRMKDQLEKSASQFSGADADAARAMATFMGKMQEQVRDYQAAATRFTEAQVFSPAFTDRSAIEPQRQVVREFLAQNARLADTVRRGEELLRTELDTAKIPARTRDATLAGFTKSQGAIRPMQTIVRNCDQRLGDDALAVLDLFDTHWGKWKRDAASGQVIFEDEKTLNAFNALIERVQATAAEQGQAQEQLARVMQTPRPL